MCNGNCEGCKNHAKDKDRRKFLGWMVGAINLALGAAILGPVAGFVGSPLKRKTRGDWISVIDYAAIPEGATQEASFALRVRDGYRMAEHKYTVFLRKKGGEVTCFDPACTHLGCRIEHQPDKGRYMCPCHGGVFDEDGNVISGPPPKPLDQHKVKVEDGKVWVYKEV